MNFEKQITPREEEEMAHILAMDNYADFLSQKRACV